MNLLEKSKNLFSSSKLSLINHPLAQHFVGLMESKQPKVAPGTLYEGVQSFNQNQSLQAGKGPMSAFYGQDKAPGMDMNIPDTVKQFRDKHYPQNNPQLHNHPNFIDPKPRLSMEP